MRDRDVTWGALLKQQLGRLDASLRVKPLAHPPVKKDVGDGNHGHALMMGHECPDDGKRASLGQTAASVIERLVQAVPTARAECNEAGKIERGLLRIDHGGKRRRIRGDYCVLPQAPFEPEARYAEVRILVGELQVPRVVSGFRDAPGNPELNAVLDLSLDDQPIGLLQKTARGC